MTSKLPVRKNIEPLYEIASELESHLEKSLKTKNEKNELIYKTFTDNLSVKNVANRDSDSEKVDDKKFKRNLKLRVRTSLCWYVHHAILISRSSVAGKRRTN